MAVEALPRHTREAMLRGIAATPIIVGAYVDPPSGGVCPMLAAHRNGGRTSLASFARAWDRYTRAKRPRLATRRELCTLRSLLEASLSLDGANPSSISAAAAEIRAEREAIAEREPAGGHRDGPVIPPVPEGAAIRIRHHRDPRKADRSRELYDPVRGGYRRLNRSLAHLC